jgi:hypothetical protein
MKRGYVDSEGLAKRLASLPSMSSDALKDEWRRLYGSPLPKKVRRTFLVAAIAYRIQEQALGGLKPETRRLLDKVANEARAGRRVEVKANPSRRGTVLVREWHGVMHQVEILEQGVRYQDRHYQSLSEVARLITGAHWSGPAFFGLKKRSTK